MKEQTESKKEVIFTDLEAYTLELKNQEAKIKIFKDILKEIEEVIELNKVDFQLLEEQRLTYIIDLFYNINQKTIWPKYVTPAKALQLTSFDSSAVYKLFTDYDSVKNYKPLKIEKNLIDISVKQTDYDWYLNQDKKDQYYAVLELIELSKKMRKIGFHVNEVSFVRATTEDCIRVQGMQLFPYYSYFKA